MSLVVPWSGRRGAAIGKYDRGGAIGLQWERCLGGGGVIKGAQTMKCKLWTETLDFSRLKVPNSRFALHGLAPP